MVFDDRVGSCSSLAGAFAAFSGLAALRSRGLPGCDHEIAQSEEDLQLVVVFGQTPVAGLPVPEEVLDDMEGVLDEGPYGGLGFFGGQQGVFLHPVPHLSDRLAAAGDLPVDLPLGIGPA